MDDEAFNVDVSTVGIHSSSVNFLDLCIRNGDDNGLPRSRGDICASHVGTKAPA